MYIENQQVALIPSLGQYLQHWLQTGLALVQIWRERLHRREALRRMLRHLNDGQLRDIGIDIYVARFERNKPFWRA